MAMHKCPIRGCLAIMPNHLLMCSPHWRLVSQEIKSEVTGAYANGKGLGTPALRDAQAKAIGFVEACIREDVGAI